MSIDLKQEATLYNPMAKDFVGYWDGVPYTIESGKSERFPIFLARHLSKHLIDRILIDGGKNADDRTRAQVEKEVVVHLPPVGPRTDVKEIKETPLTAAPDTDPYKEVTMAQIREIAKQRGISVPVGTTKQAAREMIGI